LTYSNKTELKLHQINSLKTIHFCVNTENCRKADSVPDQTRPTTAIEVNNRIHFNTGLSHLYVLSTKFQARLQPTCNTHSVYIMQHNVSNTELHADN